MPDTSLAEALNGFEALIEAQVQVRTEAAIAAERASIQKAIDNAVAAKLEQISPALHAALSAVETAVGVLR